jgi:DNA-binding transcriptional LysR family regulator
MELRQMRYFVAVAEELNFTKAASKVFLTQQSLSEQIRKLEDRLGVRLLERNTRNVQLTKAGNGFLQDAKRILQLSDEAVQRVQRTDYASKLEVSFTITALGTVLPGLQQLWLERYPDVDLSLVERCTRDGVQALLEGRADVAFVHMLAPHPKLEVHELLRDPSMLVVSSSHALARRKVVSIDDLRGLNLIASPLSEAPKLRAYLRTLCLEHGFEPSIALELQPQTAQLNALLSRPDCAAIVGASLRAAAPAQLRFIPLRGIEALPLHVAVRRDEHQPLTRAFWNLAHENRAAFLPSQTTVG